MPYYRPSTRRTRRRPVPDFGVNRDNWYGFVNRDFQKTKQDIGTINAEIKINARSDAQQQDRASQRSILDYIGTLPEAPTSPIRPALWTLSANPQSRSQVTDVVANQTEATYKFDTGRLEAHHARRRRNLAEK